ncbi:MAG: TonB-dependent receptor plug domain-containing protein [Gemmatimonadales bacterium]
MRLTASGLVLAAAILGYFGLPAAAPAQAVRDVSGTVRAVQDSTPLGGVQVRVGGLDLTITTRDDGSFRIPRVPRRRVQMVFSRIGVESDTLWLGPRQDSLAVFLKLVPVRLEALTAQARGEERKRFDEEVQPSIVRIDRSTIRRLPALVEADVVRVVQLRPGTVALNDYTVGFNVRGGEPDQNLTQLDGVTILNPSHLGGLFSTFDADAVEDIDFMTGGFPAEYGGRLSSVLDVGVRPGRSDRWGARGSISLLSSKLLVEGPVPGTGASVLVAGRRTYADVLVKSLSEEVLPYHFADALAKATTPVGRGGNVSVTGYWGRDVVDWTWIEEKPGQEAVVLTADWGNRLLGVSAEHPFGESDLSLDLGYTEFSTGFGLEPGIFAAQNTVRLLTASGTVELTPGAHVLRLGAGVEDYDMTYDVGSESFGTEFFSATFGPRVWSVFADDQWRPREWLLVRPGARVEAVEGPDVVTVAPRVGVKGFLTRDLALTGSVGRYYQAIQSLRDQNVPWNIFDFWVGADTTIPVARSDHLVLGIEGWIGSAFSMSLEGYRKTFHDLIDVNVREDPKVPGDETRPVDGDAWGWDLLVRKHQGSVTGWIAYSLSKTVRRADGVEFPAVHDRRHTLNVVVQAPGPAGAEMSVRWGYGSPLPYTPFVGEWRHRFYRASSHTLGDYEQEPIASPLLNSARYPYYGRFDVSLRWDVHALGGVLRPYVQMVNVLNRKNVFLYTFDYTRTPATRSAVSQLPLLPSVGLEFEF